MHDGDDTRAVQVARLEGRVDGIERASARHVDRELYQSESRTLRGDIDEVKATIASVRADLKADVATLRRDLQDAQDKLSEQRRWVIGAVVIPSLGAAVAVLMGVLS